MVLAIRWRAQFTSHQATAGSRCRCSATSRRTSRIATTGYSHSWLGLECGHLRRVSRCCVLLGTAIRRLLIDACNPMLCPIHAARGLDLIPVSRASTTRTRTTTSGCPSSRSTATTTTPAATVTSVRQLRHHFQHFSRMSRRYHTRRVTCPTWCPWQPPPNAPCGMPAVVPRPIGCGLGVIFFPANDVRR